MNRLHLFVSRYRFNSIGIFTFSKNGEIGVFHPQAEYIQQIYPHAKGTNRHSSENNGSTDSIGENVRPDKAFFNR